LAALRTTQWLRVNSAPENQAWVKLPQAQFKNVRESSPLHRV
jgi:hypothetical protein